jgi:beta-lactamase class A
MKRISLIQGLLLISLALSCTKTRSIESLNHTGGSTASPQVTQPANANQVADLALQRQLEEIASAAQGHVGVAALVLETGQTVSLNPQDHFPMQSVYKLPIGMAVMKQVDAGKIALEQKVSISEDDFIGRAQHSPIRDLHPHGAVLSVRELMEWMLKESDGTASDVLMKLAGGPPAIQNYLNDLKINDLIVLNTEKEFSQDQKLQYRNWATPAAAVALLRALHERQGLSETSQKFLLKLMVESIPGAKRLKGLLPSGTVVAHKTGTSGTVDGVTAATNDIGLVTSPGGASNGGGSAWHLAIAVFFTDSTADEKTREGVIARVAKVVWDKFAEQ